ncbi:NFX1-type zinc finger-containing protein 1 [Ceratitis capitata]|uniref:NFX1-type zinc finger-containing protein 1 n=1 Tax=Ceratitis capitata TaxID=7213 RepID=UPI000329A567|nr:NFX1-type zinc finger-containing protein 1 [Ceratitis capitata]
MSNLESDDQDWFNKDEDEILQDLQTKVNIDNSKNEKVEYIHGSSEIDEYLQHKRLEASSNISNVAKSRKLTTADMRKSLDMEPLDTFLFLITNESNFFVDQITVSDGLDRIILYLRIWSRICKLELPGFQNDLLIYLAKHKVFMEQLRVVATKLFRKKFNSLWKDDAVINEILSAMNSLIRRLHKSQLLTSKVVHVIRQIKKLIEDSDNTNIVQRLECDHLVLVLNRVIRGEKTELKENTKIYPSPEELSANAKEYTESVKSVQPSDNMDVLEYITLQKEILREDFMIPLREFVIKLKDQLPMAHGPEIYEDVCIVLNKDFVNVKRHEMMFIDVLGKERPVNGNDVVVSRQIKANLSAIKTGALLLLTTNRNFENLILATVTYTDGELLGLGYISIEIVRNYNITAIYDRPFLMFETPAFFEPYNNVYKYLNDYGDDDLPMKQYIINGQREVCSPRYVEPNKSYTFEGESFKINATQSDKPKKLPLNESQWKAYREALTKEFSLIQGPPGTGKTHLSVQLVRTLINNAKTPIVLITYTNDSLDKFLLKLSEYTSNILRFGSQTRIPELSKFNVRHESNQKEMVNPHLKRLYYITNEEFKAKFQKMQEIHTQIDGSEESYQSLLAAQRTVSEVSEKLKTIRIMFQFYAARKADIIAMTSTCAARINFLFRLLQSKIVIFEEAAEILEAHVLACLTPFTEHVIMIGDHMQLKPYTSTYHHSSTYQLNISLFERLFVNNMKGPTLDVQYRMRPCIAELIQPTFYSVLNHDDSVKKYPNVRNMGKNLYFCTHDQSEFHSQNECSIYNKYEIKQIVDLAKYLITEAAYTANDIVILSPYAKQIERLKSMINNDFEDNKPKVSTVDSFQGLEANIVLLSLVRSNTKDQIGFLKEKNRICVALSRAKLGLYIIGNMPLLAKCSETWRSIEEKLIAQEAIGNKFPKLHEKIPLLS